MRTLILLLLLLLPSCKLATNQELYQARDFDRLLVRAFVDKDEDAFRLYQKLAKENPDAMRQRRLAGREAASQWRWRMHRAHHRANAHR